MAQRQPDTYWRVRTALLLANAGPGYVKGLPWYFTGLRLAEQLDCQTCQADALGGIGYNYALLSEWPLAMRYTRQSLRLHRQLRDQNGEYRTLIGLAELYLQQAQYPAAVATFRQAAPLMRTPDDSLTVAAGLAEVYQQQGHYPQAKDRAWYGLRLARRLSNRVLITTLEATLASVHLRQHQTDSALYYGRRAWAHRQRDAGQVDAGTCQLLARAYAARGNFAQSYAFQQRAQAYGDTLTSDKIRSNAAQARYSYELEKQQRQIVQLERDRALGQLRHQQQLAVGGLLGLLGLVAGGGAIWAVRRRQGRRVAALRAQLATDLHDEVGTLLTRVSVQGVLLPRLTLAQRNALGTGSLAAPVAGAGTSTQAHRYQFTDANLACYASGQVYYRLRQVDADGTGTYSPVRAVAVPMAAGWLAQVFPNPSGSAAPISLRLQTERGGEVQLTLSDALGRRVARQAAPLGAGTTTLPLDFATGLPPGVYLLHVRQGAQQQVLQLVRR